MKKNFLFLMLILLLALVACNEKGTPSIMTTESTTSSIITTDDLPAPEIITVYAVNDFERKMAVGESDQQLDIITQPIDASQYVIWTSSDEAIATVSDMGLVSAVGAGDVIIYAISKADAGIKGQYSIRVFDDTLSNNQIARVKNSLNTLIPDELNSDLELPLTLEDGAVRLSWTSSNEEVLNNTGQFNREEEDTTVVLNCTITAGRVVSTWNKEVSIKGINNIEKVDLTSQPAVFMYVADANFTSFRDGDLDGIDVINYAFARINTSTNEVNMTGLRNYASIIRARNYGIRVVLSIGGWACDGFSNACSTESNRITFVNSIIEVIKSHKFDGIDIDWEYPTNPGNGYAFSAADQQNFTALLKLLREEMDKIDENLILSAALAGTTSTTIQRYYEVDKISQYLDYVHLMTYSMSLQYAYHNSALYYSEGKSRPSNPVSIESVATTYIELGITPKQIVIGAAFFGVVHTTIDDGPNGDGIGATVVTGSSKETSYKLIAQNYFDNNVYKLYTDPIAQACYIYGNKTFISLENAYSIDAKCTFVKNKGYGGIMVWEYNQDDDNSTLLKRIMFNMK